jgi:N-acetylated-alpha-linked acidic dipeptidase
VNGPGGDGSYHSTDDNPTWFKKYIDPQFKFSVLAAQVTGVALLRLADAEVLPFDYESYGRQILEYVDEIEKQAIKASPEAAKSVDFVGLKAAADAFSKAGANLRAAGETLLGTSTPGEPESRPEQGRGTSSGPAPSSDSLARMNHALMMAERDLIEPAGLPERPWYRHVIYAPGLYTGYGVKTIPGVREAIDSGNYARAAEQARIVISALERATKTLWP